MKETVMQAKIGSIVPLFKEIYEEINALDYFAKLSNYGKKKNSVLICDKDKSFGTANPCLAISGKNSNFEIKALNDNGKKILAFVKNEFGFCDKASYSKDKIHGILNPARKAVQEDQRIKLRTHIDIMRTIAFAFKPSSKELHYPGLTGIISYDFVNNIEDIEKNQEDLTNDPDYLLYFFDNFFLVDHNEKKTYFVANALVTDNKKEQVYEQCTKTIKGYEKALEIKLPKSDKFKKKEFKVSFDTSKDEFLGIIKELKKNIVENNVLHAVPSRMVMCSYNCEPLDLLLQIKKFSSNLHYYINDEFGISMGHDSGSSLKIYGDDEKAVDLKIVSATKPRGRFKEIIDKDLDNRYEALLRVNPNKTIKHTMLLDAARNEVAKICKPGTRNVKALFFVEKQQNNQHLVSSVNGILKDDLDALNAYLSSINFDLSGLPKLKAIELLRKLEKSSRGFYSGSMIHLTSDGNFNCSAIENFRIKKDTVYFRASSFVSYSTIEDAEMKENESKIAAILNIIKSAGGLK